MTSVSPSYPSSSGNAPILAVPLELVEVTVRPTEDRLESVVEAAKANRAAPGLAARWGWFDSEKGDLQLVDVRFGFCDGHEKDCRQEIGSWVKRFAALRLHAINRHRAVACPKTYRLLKSASMFFRYQKSTNLRPRALLKRTRITRSTVLRCSQRGSVRRLRSHWTLTECRNEIS
jgi:hypothetical protein